jgi:peptidylprolyl isomerase
MAIEITRIVPGKAHGEQVTPPAGLPTVTLADDGTPSITIPKGMAEPKDLVAQTLVKGDGPKVTSGQTLAVQYSGWLLDGTKFDATTWKNGAPFEFQVDTGGVVKGWDKGLLGQTVGSQVLLVIPPSLGYGDSETGSIPANSTLVFVVDILAADG